MIRSFTPSTKAGPPVTIELFAKDRHDDTSTPIAAEHGSNRMTRVAAVVQ